MKENIILPHWSDPDGEIIPRRGISGSEKCSQKIPRRGITGAFLLKHQVWQYLIGTFDIPGFLCRRDCIMLQKFLESTGIEEDKLP